MAGVSLTGLAPAGTSRREGVSLHVYGAAELSAAFAKLSREAQDRLVLPGLERGAQVVLGLARQRAPVRTGRLRDTMFARKGRKGKRGVSWIVQTGTRDQLQIPKDEPYYYPFVVEYGGVVGAKAKTALAALGSVLGVRGKVRHIRAHPFMRPAADAAKPQVASIIMQTIAAGIRAILIESKVRTS